MQLHEDNTRKVILQLKWDGAQNELLWLILHTTSATVLFFICFASLN